MTPIKSKYAIFLPMRNGEPYIAKAIDSVLAQQFSDLSLIVLENKSTDNSLSIVRGYKDPRITIVESPKPLGIYESWRRIYDLINSGAVQSEFSTTLGHDDVLYPDFLSTIEGLIKTYPDASLYQTHFDIIDQTGKIDRPSKPIPERESYKDFFLARCRGVRDSFGTGYVFRTTDYVKVGGIPDYPLLLWSDDLLIMGLAKISYKVCSEKTAFAYRSFKQSASGAINVNKFKAQITALAQYLKEIKGRHRDLLTTEEDEIALGFLTVRILDWYEFPFQKAIMGKETAEMVENIRKEGERLLHGHTLHELSRSNFTDRLYSKLRQYCVMLFFCFAKGNT